MTAPNMVAIVSSLLLLWTQARAEVVVSQEVVRDRRGRATGWTAVRLDSGRKVFTVRFDGKQAGLGPAFENWYGNGFFTLFVGSAKSSACHATLEVVGRGPDAGVVRIVWDMPDGQAEALFELRDGDDKLLLTLKLPRSRVRSVRFLCYPSAFAGGYQKGLAVRKRHTFTATQDVTLDGKHGVTTPLSDAEPWVLFADDHFDVAHKRGVGPCAALYFPHEVSKAAAVTSNYACYLNLVPKATVQELHVVLWDFAGMSNAAALEYVKALELVPASDAR